MKFIIMVKKTKYVSTRKCRCEIGSGTDISVLLGPYYRNACVHAFPMQQDVLRLPVRAAIVSDTEFPIFEDLGAHALDRTVEQTDGRIIDWQDNRNGRQSAVSQRQCGGKIISVRVSECVFG